MSDVQEIEAKFRESLRDLIRQLKPGEEIVVNFKIEVRNVAQSTGRSQNTQILTEPSSDPTDLEKIPRTIVYGPFDQTPGSPKKKNK